MAQSLFTAAAGLMAQQKNIDTIAHNIANVNTDGFKRSRMDFQEAVYAAMQDPSLPADKQTENLQRGTGAIAVTPTRILEAGSLTQSGRMLDMAITGDGFFAVEDADGGQGFTRDGKFQSMTVEGTNYLATSTGRFVLDEQGERISSKASLDKIQADESGRLALDGAFVANLGIHTVAGTRRPGSAAIRQGYVEGSNVDMADEMPRLMRAQRAYAFLGRAISASDAMSAVENEIRR
jgi:flagellar basal-body rod protein FlgG